ncbi:MFS transporter [Antribacter sp. KLBMP9083]|uniref:MFS transporter n=1 Tax=Antribacter soli TaxID=2910976 RepID=A0AA41UAA5_9MICO|nr:MFS transporter [Antribacter soli]MCF4122432.1 MFS transporter [Antribacter soli]
MTEDSDGRPTTPAAGAAPDLAPGPGDLPTEATAAPSAGVRLGASFAKVWTASTLSNLADGVLKIAVPLVAVQYTQSPILIAGIGFAMSLPWLVFALPFGAVVDRVDRRRAMLLANSARLVVAGLVAAAVWGGLGNIWLLYAAALVCGVAEVLYDTSAQSILPQVVDRSALTKANSRLYLGELTANQFVGPPVGGFLVAAGAALALGAPAALWAFAVAALAWVPGSFRVERAATRTTLSADIKEGLTYLVHHRVLRTLAAMTGLSNFTSSAAFAVFVLYAVGPSSPMGLTEAGYGALSTTSAIGSVVGSLFAAQAVAALGRAWSLGIGVVTFTLMIGVPAITPNAWAIGATWVLAGAGVAIWNVIAVSLRQQITPDRMLGRLNSCYRLLAWGTMPLGAAAGGVLAELFGLRATFAVCAVISALTALGLFVATDRAMDEAEAAAREPEPAT